jgi:hypothetical protein
MARRVLADFDSEINRRLANRDDFSSTDRAQFLHDAYLWVCASFVHPQIEATAEGTQAIGDDEIVVDASDVWWVELVTGVEPKRNVYPGDKDVIENMVKGAGFPTRYYWWGEEIITDRLPAVAYDYTIRYVKVVPEITTSPLTDRLFDPVIIMKAAEIGLSTVRDMKEAIGVSGEIDRYTARFNLPKRMAKFPSQNAGLQPRTK